MLHGWISYGVAEILEDGYGSIAGGNGGGRNEMRDQGEC